MNSVLQGVRAIPIGVFLALRTHNSHSVDSHPFSLAPLSISASTPTVIVRICTDSIAEVTAVN